MGGHNRIDLTGQTFGRLRVLKPAPGAVRDGRRRDARWLCLCECGNETTATTAHLRFGNRRSCGCGFSQHARHGHMRGDGRSPTANSYRGMLERCTNSNHRQFANYGGRGITVCERWRSFENFLADMGERPGGPKGSADHHSLERIDNDGNYEPDNCRWATEEEQARNRRPRRARP